MIDIHSHIIPQIDDGARNLDESLDIASLETSGGTSVIIATPHVVDVVDFDKSPRILEEVERLNREFSSRELGLRVVPGAELYPSRSIMKALDEGLPITLAGTGKYVLLDLPHSLLPNDFDSTLFEIQSRGVVPILAHPERCPTFQGDAEAVRPYIERGIVFQLNVGSFVGRHGPHAASCAKALFRMRLAHFLASDTHRARNNSLGDVAKTLSAEDAAYVKMLTVDSGQAVLEGRRLPDLPAPVSAEKRESWLSKTFGRRSVPYKAIKL